MVMGQPGAAVNAWYWRADEPTAAREISAEGLGTSEPLPGSTLRANGRWRSGRWSVVLARSLQGGDAARAAQLQPGLDTGFGVAIWDGSNQERGGIKAFSGEWQPLSLEGTGRS